MAYYGLLVSVSRHTKTKSTAWAARTSRQAELRSKLLKVRPMPPLSVYYKGWKLALTNVTAIGSFSASAANINQRFLWAF